MDVVTHALLGAQTAYAVLPARYELSVRERLVLGATAAAFPDLDFIAFPFDPLRFLADWHQGPTHSLVLLPVWAALIAAIYTAAARRKAAFKPAVFACAAGFASHILADVITAYGTALFYPVSDARYALSTTFVIDPLFTLIVVGGLLLALRLRRRAIAGAGLAVLALYVSVQWQLRENALALAGPNAAAALPQPYSPLNWKLIVDDGERYRETYVNLAGHKAWLPESFPFGQVAHSYPPMQSAQWRVRARWGTQPSDRALTKALWQDPRFEPFRRFARYPAVSRIDRDGDATCVWFTDLRYDLPGLPDTFRYGFCRDNADAPWQPYRLRYFTAAERQRLPDRP